MNVTHPHAKRRALILWMTATAGAFGQSQAPSEITVGGVHIKGVPMDWSHRHVIFSNPGMEAEAIKAGTHDRWLKIVNDPRYAIQQLQRQQPGQGPAGAQVASLLAAAPPTAGDDTPDKKRKHRDWSMDLGTGSIPANTFPAKWSFGTTMANCASDFVMFPAGKNGSPSQATIVAYNNLYAGCGGTVPSVYWQYNANSIGSDLSPVLSADGTQVAFMSHSLSGGPLGIVGDSLVILKWAANSSLVSLSPIPAASYRNCTAPCMTTLFLSGVDGNSSPFYDYVNDAIYVGSSGGVLYKFTGVFNGTPAAASSPWPVTVAAGTGLSSPVLDAVSGLITVGSLNGHLYSVNSSTGAVAGTSSQLDALNGIYDAPLVDSSAAMVYAFAGYDGNGSCSDGLGHTGCSGVFQFPVTFSSGAGTEVQVGLGYLPLFSGAFDNAYYNSSNASSPTGNLYVCGQTDTNAQQTLNQIPIAANVMGAQTASSYPVGNGTDCSPVTEFYNTSAATDYVFLSSEAAYQGCTQNAGCLFGFNVTSGAAPDNAEFDTQAGGTSGIVVDNSVGSGTLAGASQIYFTTLSNTGTCATSGGTGLCGVQDSQTSLYVDWSQYRNTLDHQGFNQYETALSPATVGGLGLKWSYAPGLSVDSSPAVANGMVYFGAQDDKVYALNASTGALLWSYTTGGQVNSSPAVANGVVYIGSNYLYALNASTGALLWRYAGSFENASPAVANGVVYIGSLNDNVYALNASTGALLWSYHTNGDIFYSSPAVANGVVYVGSDDHNVYALNAGTGALLWSYTTGSFVYSSPAVANGVVYVGSYDDNVYALNASTGALLWSYPTGSNIFSSPAVANGVVYVGSLDQSIYALNASTGALLWSYRTNGLISSSPAVANGVVYVGSDDQHVYALNAATGALLWSYATNSEVESTPAVANGVVYVGADDQHVYAFALP